MSSSNDGAPERAASHQGVERELGWAAKPGTELLRLSWPIAVSMISYAVMTVADTLFVGHIGPAAIAGVGLGGVTACVLGAEAPGFAAEQVVFAVLDVLANR